MATRRRTNSSASSLRAGHARGVSRQVVQPRSSHTSDEFLRPFLAASFDPASFLNGSLPPLQQRSALASASLDGPSSSSTAELSGQAQALVTQLNAHTTRLTTTLTAMTDDMLRSGSRLAYEVELLRGETLGLAETMNETLHDDIRQFVPGGLQAEMDEGGQAEGGEQPQQQQPQQPQQQPDAAAAAAATSAGAAPADDPLEPPHIKQLQTLKLVRERLDSVIRTFGDAMEFAFPPSELSVGSSFLSVSAPEPGSQQQQSLEDKGQEVTKRLRDEVAGLLAAGDDPVEGVARAAQRVEQLKELTTLWKGTAEEKGRTRFIDSLAKMVEDRHRELMREMEQAARREEQATSTSTGRPRKNSAATLRAAAAAGAAADASSGSTAAADDGKSLPGGFGLLNQLSRLRSGL